MSDTPVSRAEARSIASKILESSPPPRDYSYVILDDYVIERQFCFVFLYQSSKHLETRDILDKLAGNGPILIDNRDGSVHILGTAQRTEYYISEFEKSIESSEPFQLTVYD